MRTSKSLDYSTVLACLRSVSLLMFPAVIVFALLDQWPYLTETFSRGQIFGRDAHNLWIAGRILLEDASVARIYDNAAFTAFQITQAGTGIGWNSWFYPPTALVLAACLGALPYWAALLAYSLAGTLSFLWAVLPPPGQPSRWAAVLLAVTAPMLVFNLIMGQNGLISTALLIGGVRLMRRHPCIAGVLFGLLAYKPILGVLLPLLFILRGEWKTFWMTSLVFTAAVLLPVLLWGIDVWVLYLSHAMPLQKAVLHHATGIGMLMIPSAFNSGRLLGLSTPANYVVHAAFAIFALALFLRHFTATRGQSSLNTQDLLVFVLATLLISPYMHNYDYAVLEAALLVWCMHQAACRTTRWTRALILICWSCGFASLFLNLLGLPLAPLLIAIALYLAMYRTSGASLTPPVLMVYP